MENTPILKNLNAVLTYAKERYANEFIQQEVVVSSDFQTAFNKFWSKKNYKVEYFKHTTVLTNKAGQQIYIPNQWFVIASYFVDFCTELLTYQELFEKISTRLGCYDADGRKQYATAMRSHPTMMEQERFISAAKSHLADEFSAADEDIAKVAGFLWKFVSNYDWWSGNKTVDRHDFFISALLAPLHVVNANSEFLALIVNSYASDLTLRRMVENPLDFTVGLELGKNVTVEQEKAYSESEDVEYVPNNMPARIGISISAASLERFRTGY